MYAISYKDYIDSLPSETKKYVKNLIKYFTSIDKIVVDKDSMYNQNNSLKNITITSKNELLLYASLNSYTHTDEENRNLLHMYNFPYINEHIDNKEDLDLESKIFTEYYVYLIPFFRDIDYLLLTPEDLIRNIYKKTTANNSILVSDIIGNNNMYNLYQIIMKKGEERKTRIKRELTNRTYKRIDEDIKKYFELVGSLYAYLNGKKKLIKKLSTTQEDLINLSLFIGIFLNALNHETSEEYKTIITYCEKLGLDIQKIKDVTKLRFHIEDKHKEDSILIINKYFMKVVTRYNHPSITKFFYDLIDDVYSESDAVKLLLSLCNINYEAFKGLNDEITEVRENEAYEAKNITIGLLPETIECINKIAKLYSYLKQKYQNGKIDKGIVDDEEDLVALSVLIVSYEYKTNLTDFLEAKGISVEIIKKLLGVDCSNINNYEYTNRDLYKFKKYIYNGNNQEVKKINISVNNILNNIYNRNVEKSDVINRIYKTVNNKTIEDISTEIDNYLLEKDINRKKELETKLLKGVSPDTYRLINLISSYYKQIKLENIIADEDVLIAVSIIAASSRFDKEISKYFESINMDRNSLFKLLNCNSFKYTKYKLDIDIINNVFKKYILDRDVKEINVYTILENTFNLIDSFEFDKFLYCFNKTKEDFVYMEDRIEAFISEERKIKHQENINILFIKCGQIRRIIDDTLRIHEYLLNLTNDNNMYTDIIKTKEDIEELSLVISVLINDPDNQYYKYFSHNGVTLEEILSTIGITKEQLSLIRDKQCNEELILEYKKYIQENMMDTNLLIRRIFDDKINKSQVLETISKQTGNKYDYLKEEVINQRMRVLTPEQGIEMLTKEITPILTGDSIIDVATYGDELSKHSSVINDALHELVFSDSIEHSVNDINELCNKVSLEDVNNTPKGIFSFFNHKKKEIEEPTNKSVIISEIRENITDNTKILNDELKGYEYIKKYIEIYLIKLNEYLVKLEEYKIVINNKIEELNNTQSNDVKAYTELLNCISLKDIIDNKINTFNTTISLMSQELVKVHRAIVTHFITINALNTSSNAILPLIASELALNAGTKSEGNALKTSKELFNLLQNIVNQNVIESKSNLDKLLEINSIDPIKLDTINKNVTSYIDMVNTSEELFNNSTSHFKIVNNDNTPNTNNVKKRELKQS